MAEQVKVRYNPAAAMERLAELKKKSPEDYKRITGNTTEQIKLFGEAIKQGGNVDEILAKAEDLRIAEDAEVTALLGVKTPSAPAEKPATRPAAVAAAGAKAEASADVKTEVSVTIQAPQKPAEEQLKFAEQYQNVERVLIRKEFAMAEADLAGSEAALKQMQENKSISEEAILAQEVKIEELKSAISGTKKLVAGQTATKVEQESVKSVFGRNVIMKGTKVEKVANEITLRAMFDPNFNAEELHGKDLFAKPAEKPAGAPTEKPAGAPTADPANAPAADQADASVGDIFEIQMATMMTNYHKGNDLSEIQDYFQMSGSEEQTKIINYLKNIGEVDLANDLENSIKTE